MAVLPFRWHGRTRVEGIRSRLEGATRAWLKDWSDAVVRCDVQVDEGDHANGMGDWVRTADRGVRLRQPPHATARLGCALAGVQDAGDPAFPEAIGRRAIAELVAAWLGTPVAPLVEDDGQQSIRQARHGVLRLKLTIDALAFEVHLASAVCDALATPAAPPAVELCKRREALLASPVRLIATLDLGQTQADSAVTLRPGEILKAAAITDAVVELHAGNGAPVLRGLLDSRNGFKALRCTHVPNQ